MFNGTLSIAQRKTPVDLQQNSLIQAKNQNFPWA
jgi:hypothetical protein